MKKANIDEKTPTLVVDWGEKPTLCIKDMTQAKTFILEI